MITDVEVDTAGAAAEGLNLLAEGGELGGVAARHRDVGTGLRKGAGEVLTEAAASAGNEGNLAGEIEESH
jgi:hypothetical protein